jgi:collagenase-like PrtC family protease
MKLSVGPLSGHFDSKTVAGFYAEVSNCPQIDRAYAGELFCAKRQIPIKTYLESVNLLRQSGKEAVFSTFALPAGDTDFDSLVPYIEAVDTVEINNFGYVSWLKEHFPAKRFVAGPICNLYNQIDLAIIEGWGAAEASLRVDLLPVTIESMVKSNVMPVEVFLYGRPPIAFSWRCYAARFAGIDAAACGLVCRSQDNLVLNNLEEEAGFIVDGPAVLPGKTLAPLTEALQYVAAGAQMGRFWLNPGEVESVASPYRSFLDGKSSDSDLREKLTAASRGLIQFEPAARQGLS